VVVRFVVITDETASFTRVERSGKPRDCRKRGLVKRFAVRRACDGTRAEFWSDFFRKQVGADEAENLE